MKLGIVAAPGSIIEMGEMLYAFNGLTETKEFGDYEVIIGPSSDCDFLIGLSVTQTPRIKAYHEAYPDIPLINYNWDIYEWVWTHKRGGGMDYDYKTYGEMLKKSIEVWHPSECTRERAKEWFGIDNGHVIRSAVPYFDYENVTDEGYAYCSLREIPDRHVDWFERACKELDIPYKWTKHELSYEEYQKTLAGCRFLVAHYFEASTGGLTLLEGYYLGKPALISNSKYMGAKDYMGDRATYFQWDDYEDFKAKLKFMWEHTPKVKKDHKSYVTKNFSSQRMAREMHERLVELKRRLS